MTVLWAPSGGFDPVYWGECSPLKPRGLWLNIASGESSQFWLARIGRASKSAGSASTAGPAHPPPGQGRARDPLETGKPKPAGGWATGLVGCQAVGLLGCCVVGTEKETERETDKQRERERRVNQKVR